MVGTPQLPLKFRRKGPDDLLCHTDNDQYTSYIVAHSGPDMSMAHHAASYPVPVPNFTNPVSVPRSPGFSSPYVPSSSSPPRSLYTPEPPSSPLSDPFVASSSTASSPRSKHFWDVAFNYGPGFPYKPRPGPLVAKVKSFQSSPTDSNFSRDPSVFSHRRSSSESAPTLMSDMDTSEYSEDIDTFSVEGDSPTMQNLDPSKHVRIREEHGTGETGLGSEVGIHAFGQHVDVQTDADSKDCVSGNDMDVDIDIAAALLDLSRRVRIASASASADRKPVSIAIKVEKAVHVSSTEKVEDVHGKSEGEKEEVAVRSDPANYPAPLDSKSPEDIEKEAKPDEDDNYMRHECSRESIRTKSEHGDCAADPDGLKKSGDLVDELSSREADKTPAITAVEKRGEQTEERIATDTDKSRLESPITVSPAATVEQNEASFVRPASDADADLTSKLEATNDGAVSVEDKLSASTQAEETSHTGIDCIQHETQFERNESEDTAVESEDTSVPPTTSCSMSAALDGDGGDDDAMGDKDDDDARSLTALSTLSSTLTPISSPLTSPVDLDDEPDFTFDRLPSPEPEPVKPTLSESEFELSLSRVQSRLTSVAPPDDVQSGFNSRSRSIPRERQGVSAPLRAPSPSPSRYNGNADQVPGPSSSSSILKSRTTPIDVGEGEASRNPSRSHSPAVSVSVFVKEDRREDEIGLYSSDGGEERRTKVKKRGKPKIMKDTRCEGKEKDDITVDVGDGADKDGKKEKGRAGAGAATSVKVKVRWKGAEDIGGEKVGGKGKPKGERKERRKRPRPQEDGEGEGGHLVSRASSLSLECSISDGAARRPRKRSRLVEDPALNTMRENGQGESSSRATSEALSSRATSVCPSDLAASIGVANANANSEFDSDIAVDSDPDPDKNAKEELCGLLIQAMALARASSMPASSLSRDLLRSHPHLSSAYDSRDALLSLMNAVLRSHAVFGRIDRQGLDAADKPLEPQWYYIPENDWDVDRATLLREMMPKKRSETKKHKQYYYRPVSKMTRWDSEDDI